MQVQMRNAESLGPEAIGAFLEASQGIEFAGQSQEEIYGWVHATLLQEEYFRQGKKGRGAIRAYMQKVTGRSRAQITRLIRLYRKTGELKSRAGRRHRFARKYTAADILLLAVVDRAHERLSGPATRHVLEREYKVYGKQEFARLAEISVSHLYNLRATAAYRRRAAVFVPTRPTAIPIGERRRPDPRGEPGHLRVDSVHQGDSDGVKGVFHINAVDEVTQWEVVGCAEGISERFLIPVLEAMLHQFPFRILGFHSDNGSEYVNYTVARLLNKLLIEFTRSRPNRSQDNGLVEGKNGAVIRKHIGYGHIPGKYAERVQKFYTAHFNPYLNFHRPCGFARVVEGARGKRRKVYRREDYVTPYEKLKSLPQADKFLKPGISFESLERRARRMSDTESGQKMRQAKAVLLRAVKLESPAAPRD
jgi:transposase InsO family protein